MDGRRRLVAGGVVAGGGMLLAAGLVLGAGVAKADTTAGEYVRLIREDPDGASLWAFSDQWLLREGVGSCSMLRQGYSHAYVMSGIRADAGLPFRNNADVTLISSATTMLCPDQSLVASLRPGSLA